MSRDPLDVEAVRLARHLVLQRGEITASDLAAELPGPEHPVPDDPRLQQAEEALQTAESRGMVGRTGRRRPGRYGVPEPVWSAPRPRPPQEGDQPWQE